MGEPPAALRTGGSREVNLPAGVDPVAGGCEGSDDSQHRREGRESGVTPTAFLSFSTVGGGGARR